MPTVNLLSMTGEKIGSVDLNEEVFGVAPNIPLMHQAVVEELANRRSGTASTKTRAYVRGGGRKPYRQKGTGRARQGSIRSPLYPGGGVVWGPHPRSYEQNMPRKMRHAAFRSALSAKLADGEMVVVDEFNMDSISCKKMVEILSKLEVSGKVLIASTTVSEEVAKSSRNIPGLVLRRSPALSIAELLDSDWIVLTKATAEQLGEAFLK